MSDDLADELRTAIESGRWRSGSQLPAIRDLAQRYQVSPNTAHAAVRQLEERGLVEYMARRGGFVKKAPARSAALNKKALKQVAIIRPLSPDEDARDNWTGQIIRGIELELNKHQLHPLMISTPTNDHELNNVTGQIAHLSDYLVGTITFAISPYLDHMRKYLAQTHLPCVAINRPEQDSANNFVSTDYFHAGEAIGQALGEAGIERAWILYQESQSNAARVAGVSQGYIQKTLSPLSLTCLPMKDWREDAGYATVHDLLGRMEPPQVIIANADPQAYGVIRALQDHDLRIPDDVGVIGTTGLALSEHVQPSLTVYQQSMTQIGMEAASMLVEMLEQDVEQIPGKLVQGRMIYRSSFRQPQPA